MTRDTSVKTVWAWVNQSYRFLHSTKQAKSQIKAREQSRKANPIEGLGTIAEPAPEPF